MKPEKWPPASLLNAKSHVNITYQLHPSSQSHCLDPEQLLKDCFTLSYYCLANERIMNIADPNAYIKTNFFFPRYCIHF